MKIIYNFILILFICITNYTYSQVWVSNYNGPANSNDKSNAVKVDAAGNVYITGYSTGIGSSQDITTIKYNSAGVQQWVSRYNGPGNGSDEAYAITVDLSGNIYVTGYSIGNKSNKDIITIKYNNGGVQQWATIHSSQDEYPDEAYAITVDLAGNTYVCGYRYDNNYDNETVIIKYDSAGAIQWTRDYNGTSGNGEDEAYAITVDAAGGIYITGSSEGNSSNKDFITIKYNSSGVQQWVQRYNNLPVNENDEAYAITVDVSNNIYVTGYSTSNNDGQDYLTIKYNSSGTQQWVARYNNSAADDDDVSRSIGVMNNNDIVVTGSSQSSSQSNKEDYLTIRYNYTDGSEVFTARFNDTANNSDIAYAVGVTPSNSRIYVTGSSRQSSSSGSEDIVTIEYTPTGSFKNKFRIKNPGEDAAHDIAVTSNDDFYIAGYLSGAGSGFNMSAAKYTGKEISISSTGTNVPSSYRLYQNYPNPFNPSTLIKFDISKSSIVKIAVYDVLGREIAVPVNEFLPGGTYEVSMILNDLPSGMYFCKMTAESFTESKTMMLIK